MTADPENKGEISDRMMILAVETATRWQSVAVLQDSQVLGCYSQDAKGSHTRWLIPSIQRLLSSLSLDFSDLTGLAVSIGPGSFSGLRVGLATMTGFRFGVGLPLVSVSTLEAMAWNLRGSDLPLCPMVKARSGEVYWARFQWEGEQLIRLVEDQVGTIQSVGQSLQSPTLLFGDGWLAYEKEFQPYLEYPYETVPSDAMWPQAMSVGLASLEYFRTGRFNGTGLVPRYIQRSYAEMKREDHSRNHSKGLGLNGKP